MSRFNLASPNGTSAPCNLEALSAWLEREIQAISSPSVRAAAAAVCGNWDEFVSWPAQALLLWHGCDRVGDAGKQKHHRYPQPLRTLAKTRALDLDIRSPPRRVRRLDQRFGAQQVINGEPHK